MRFLCGIGLVLFLSLVVACDHQGAEENDLTAAREAASEHDWTQVARLLQRYLRDHDDPEKRWTAWNLLVTASLRMGENAWAIDYLETMLQEYEHNEVYAAAVLRQLGDSYEKIRAWDKAARAWLHLLDLEEFSPDETAQIYRRMGIFYQRSQEFGLAEDMLEMCVEQAGSPHILGECQFYLAQAYATDGHPDDALGHITKVLDIKDVPASIKGQALFLRGDILEQQGKRAAATQAFAEAIPFHPNPKAVQKRLDYLKKAPLLPAAAKK